MTPTYDRIVKERVESGQRVPSRYGDMLEVRAGRVVFMAGEIPQREHLNPAIGWCEMLQLIGGIFDHEAYERVAPQAMLHLFTENGAYGPRLHDQLDRCVLEIPADRVGRQHIVYVSTPGDQYKEDTPCTTSIQFLVRGGRVVTHVCMRSSDVVKGLPYDIMMFGGLAMAVARCVGFVAGPVIVDAGSSHVYVEDLDKARTAQYHTRHFKFNDQVPTTWSAVKDWAALEAVSAPWPSGLPLGVSMLRQEGKIGV